MHFFHSTSTIGFLLALFALISVSHVALGNSELQEVRAFKWEGVFNFVGVAMFAYEGICTALPVRYSMSEKFRFNKVFLISSITGLLMYQTFIVINCNAYGDSLKQIIFFNLPEVHIHPQLDQTDFRSLLPVCHLDPSYVPSPNPPCFRCAAEAGRVR